VFPLRGVAVPGFGGQILYITIVRSYRPAAEGTEVWLAFDPSVALVYTRLSSGVFEVLLGL
jgi:hypothetical protein